MNNTILVFLFSLIAINGFSQKPSLFFCVENSNQRSFLKETDMKEIILFYQNEFNKNNALEFDTTMLRNAIDNKIPDENYFGYAVLDWEGKGLDILSKGNVDKDFSKVMNSFIEGIEYAKKLRPNVKWSYYGIPIRSFWDINEKWKKKNYDLMPILEKSDFIAPSIYAFYDTVEPNARFNYNYIVENTKLALEIGNLLKKPTYVFVWNRFHPSNKVYGNKLLPLNEFNFYVKTILSVKGSHNLHVNGIIWWNSEQYLYGISMKEKSKSPDNEYSAVKDFNSYQTDLLKKYYGSISKLF